MEWRASETELWEHARTEAEFHAWLKRSLPVNAIVDEWRLTGTEFVVQYRVLYPKKKTHERK